MPVGSVIDEGVAIITLERPEVLNAFDDEMGRDVLDAVRRASADDAARCIVLTGAGRAFSSGEDLGALAADYEAGRAPELGDTLIRRYNPLITAIRAAPKPVVAAVNGVAAGAGASIALACDFRVAAHRAKLVLAFVKVGLVPDSGALWFLTRMIGSARAWDLAATAKPLSAPDALALGIFDEVFPDEGFEEGWRSFAAELARGPTRAYALIKRLISGVAERSLEEQLDLEIDAQTEAGHSEDHLEGVRAFLAKRAPDFKGR